MACNKSELECAGTPSHATEDNEICRLMDGRATLYNLLARVFMREVDGDFLAELRAMRYPQNSDNPLVNESFKRVYLFLRHAREDVLDVLSVDYARTFLGSGVLNPNAAFPYESVYTSEHALVMQEARDEVLAIYRSQGFSKDESWKDPEDHIALELEFLGVLCTKTREALDAGDDQQACALVKTQYRFLCDHILNWAPRFLTDVPRYAQDDFYRAFAELTGAFIADEKLMLEDIAAASGIGLEEGEEHA